MDNFLKWGLFISAVLLLFITLYEAKENKKLRDAINAKNACSCDDHAEGGTPSSTGNSTIGGGLSDAY